MIGPDYDDIVDDDQPFWDAETWEIIATQADQIEFDWFAVDQTGVLGVFSSFGTGPTPELVRSSRERFNKLLLAVVRLPRTCSPMFHQPASVDTSDWEAYARRGLFAYDNGDVHAQKPPRHYQPIAWPARPLRLAESSIPSDLHAALPVIHVTFQADAPVPFELIPT